MIRVSLFTRSNCKLCDEAHQNLESLQKKIPHELILIDIDNEPELFDSYNERVPVVEIGPYKIEAPFDLKKLEMTLGAARDRSEQLKKYGNKKQRDRKVRSQTFSRGDRISSWISKRYLLLLNFFLFAYVGLSFLAPVLMNAGYPALAKPIYGAYGFVCHQMAFRSWFLYGDQPVYPRAAAGVDGLVPYGEATGEDEGAIWDARNYLGNEEIGYKVAFCERDVAIYSAMLIFGVIYFISKRRIPALPWYLWGLIGIAPIAIDGFSQLFSQIPNFTLWEYRESTPFLRTLTGGLFGFTTAWFGFPVVEETMAETRLLLAGKLARTSGATKDE